jgi:hypothetical protein
VGVVVSEDPRGGAAPRDPREESEDQSVVHRESAFGVERVAHGHRFGRRVRHLYVLRARRGLRVSPRSASVDVA